MSSLKDLFVIKLNKGGDWARIADVMRTARSDTLAYTYCKYQCAYLVEAEKEHELFSMLREQIENFGGKVYVCR